MNELHNRALTSNSQELRKNMTSEEKHLWYDFLKKLPVSVKRQKVIGRYIVDFYCPTAKTVIELDGSQHYEQGAREEDRIRDEYLNAQGIKVLRYSNYVLKNNFDGVCKDIAKNICPEVLG